MDCAILCPYHAWSSAAPVLCPFQAWIKALGCFIFSVVAVVPGDTVRMRHVSYAKLARLSIVQATILPLPLEWGRSRHEPLSALKDRAEAHLVELHRSLFSASLFHTNQDCYRLVRSTTDPPHCQFEDGSQSTTRQRAYSPTCRPSGSFLRHLLMDCLCGSLVFILSVPDV